jgi:hypothetical protein
LHEDAIGSDGSSQNRSGERTLMWLSLEISHTYET